MSREHTTAAEAAGERDDGSGISARRARLVAAVAHAVAEVHHGAEAGVVAGTTPKGLGLAQHVGDAGLLEARKQTTGQWGVLIIGDQQASKQTSKQIAREVSGTHTTLRQVAQTAEALRETANGEDGDGEDGGLHFGEGKVAEEVKCW